MSVYVQDLYLIKNRIKESVCQGHQLKGGLCFDDRSGSCDGVLV